MESSEVQVKPLTVTEDQIEGPEPIERTLRIGAVPIAVAHVDPKRLEGILVWPLIDNVQLYQLLTAFASDFLDRRHPFSNATIGYWSGKDYLEQKLNPDVSASDTISAIVLRMCEARGTPQLLNISCDELTLELVFADRSVSPIRAALALSGVDVEALADFFTRFHKSDLVRDDPKIGETAFSLSSPTAIHPSRQGIGFLRPLMLTKKKYDGLHGKETWD